MQKVTKEMTTKNAVNADYYYLTLDELKEKVNSGEDVPYLPDYLDEKSLLELSKYADIRILVEDEDTEYSDTIFISKNHEFISSMEFTCLIHKLGADECDMENANWMRLWWD